MTLATDVCFRPTEVDAAPALPGEPCQVEPRATWAETEKWVWDLPLRRRDRDLNEHFNYAGGPPLEPQFREGWTDKRKLGSAFLETVLIA